MMRPIILLRVLLTVFSSSSSQRHDGLRHLGPRDLPEDSRYWDRLLQDAEGSMEPPSNDDIPGLVVAQSIYSFDETYSNLIAALNTAPVNIMAEIPHSDAAANVSLELKPNKLVVFGNPNLGTPLMQESRETGIDLPQKMLVWQDVDDIVHVGYNSVTYLEFRHEDIADGSVETQRATIAGALSNFAAAASGVPKEEIQVNDDIIGLISTGISTKQSDADFETTWTRLLAAIEGSPASVAFSVDHSANGQAAGIQLLPTRLVVFGNPLLGAPLMQASPSAGIDLPLKILVWEQVDGSVQVTTNEIRFYEARHKIEGIDDALNRIQTAIENFMSAATGQQV